MFHAWISQMMCLVDDHGQKLVTKYSVLKGTLGRQRIPRAGALLLLPLNIVIFLHILEKYLIYRLASKSMKLAFK